MKTKVICIHTGPLVPGAPRVPSLTLHKIYDGFIYEPPATHNTHLLDTIQVVDDSGYVKTYKGERFMRLDEFRNNKLKQLGI
jgi:hypothetical protein